MKKYIEEDPFDPEICLKYLKEVIKLDEHKLKTYAKLSEDIFVDGNNPDTKNSQSALLQLKMVKVKEWTNIPFCLCDTITAI
jgi:hypothetical protein